MTEFDKAGDLIRVQSIEAKLKSLLSEQREPEKYFKLFGDSRENWEIGINKGGQIVFSNGSRKGHNLAETVCFEKKDEKLVCVYSNDMMLREGDTFESWLSSKEWSAFAKLTADKIDFKK